MTSRDMWIQDILLQARELGVSGSEFEALRTRITKMNDDSLAQFYSEYFNL